MMVSKPGVIFFIAISAIYIVGYFNQFVTPWLVGSLMTDLEITASQAGTIISVEYAGLAVAALICVTMTKYISVRATALIAILVALASNLLSVFAESYSQLLVLRMVAGIGEGVAFALSNAIVATTRNPDKIYGELQVLSAVLGAMMVFSTGYVVGAFGYQGIFVLLAGVCLLALIIVLTLMSDSTRSMDKPSAKAWRVSSILGMGGLTVLSMFLFNLCEGALWSFAERRGVELGLTQENLSLIFGVGAVVGTTGGLVASLIHVRFGRTLPILLGLGLNALVVLLAFTTNTTAIFVVTYLAIQVFWFFCVPYIFGTAAAVDNLGQLAALLSSALMVGLAVSPLIAGYMVDWWGLGSIGWFGFANSLGAMLSLLIVTRWLDRSARGDFRSSRLA